MLLARIGCFFPRNDAIDSVATRVHLDASPDAVWNGMLFYEEVPGRASMLLRMFVPAPIRTQGEKTRVGSTIECTYDGGYLEKRIISAERASFVRFDVLVQALGIEDSISMTGGSYETRADGAGSEITLTTRYRGHMRPRWLFRPFERFPARRMHLHILNGMRVALAESASSSPTSEIPKHALPLVKNPA